MEIRPIQDSPRRASRCVRGRGHPENDPGTRLEDLGADSAGRLLETAARRLDRPCRREERSGRVEREVVAAAAGTDLLVMALGRADVATLPPPPPH